MRKACPKTAYKPLIAVKFIHKEHAYKHGRVKPKQIAAEISLHSHVGAHQNIIKFLGTGEDVIWTWIAMELASGDLFDKIEADQGVGEDVAHFYFSQLISAVSYMHSRDVAHRDIKPENILLSDGGDLKLADFGLAVLFAYNGEHKLCQTVCGSPPYMAPEVVPHDGFTGSKTAPYLGNMADIWSCGIVLFVLFVGNTPWDEPTQRSFEFCDYLSHGITSTDELWARVPQQAISLLRGILHVDPGSRFTLEDVRRHPWFTRANSHMAADGRAANPLSLATQMLESLRIDLRVPLLHSEAATTASAGFSASQPVVARSEFASSRRAFTRCESPSTDLHAGDWERPLGGIGVSASQPIPGARHMPIGGNGSFLSLAAQDRLQGDPSLSQFSATPSVPMSVTQGARRFADIVPAHGFARFLSFMDLPLLLPLLCEALCRLGISANAQVAEDGRAGIPIRTRDTRHCQLRGTVAVERVEEDVVEVRFLKATGDPVEWRRLFKKVAILCRDGILKPDD